MKYILIVLAMFSMINQAQTYWYETYGMQRQFNQPSYHMSAQSLYDNLHKYHRKRHVSFSDSSCSSSESNDEDYYRPHKYQIHDHPHMNRQKWNNKDYYMERHQKNMAKQQQEEMSQAKYKLHHKHDRIHYLYDPYFGQKYDKINAGYNQMDVNNNMMNEDNNMMINGDNMMNGINLEGQFNVDVNSNLDLLRGLFESNSNTQQIGLNANATVDLYA